MSEPNPEQSPLRRGSYNGLSESTNGHATETTNGTANGTADGTATVEISTDNLRVVQADSGAVVLPEQADIRRITSAGPDAAGQVIDIMANFVVMDPMKQETIYQYRVDYEPNIESKRLRYQLFKLGTEFIFHGNNYTYDGVSDVRSRVKTQEETVTTNAKHPLEPDTFINLTIKRVGTVNWSSSEMIRLYNMNMRSFLKMMGFFQAGHSDVYVHHALRDVIESNHKIAIVRGYRTACNVHERGKIMVQLEGVHKLVQMKNIRTQILEYQEYAHANNFHVQDWVKVKLEHKLCITIYGNQKRTYKIEDVDFSLSPESTFKDHKNDRDVSYIEYYRSKYGIQIKDPKQPLLVAKENRKQRRDANSSEERCVNLIPELCNQAGLTDHQRDDNKLKMELIKKTQMSPEGRVKFAQEFLTRLHENEKVQEKLKTWGYSLENSLIKIKGRILPAEKIGAGRDVDKPPASWPKVDSTGGFDRLIITQKIACLPDFSQLAIIISRTNARQEGTLLEVLRTGVEKVDLRPHSVKVFRIREGDSSNLFARQIRELPETVTAAIVIMNSQNKERYDAIKKVASVERGIPTQVVTAKLLMDDRKARSAAIKIGIQISAKIGGEPWFVHIPLKGLMVCGYDTYHDTANRGRSFGAFVASSNNKISRWFSRADPHEHLDELSTNLAANMAAAMEHYKKVNDVYPARVILYRDGVSDGQLSHVFDVELKKIRDEVEGRDRGIKLSIVVVNKRAGARFYMRNSNPSFVNPPPGTVIDDHVTRETRYDFYLISQSTRNGTVNPTYYSIIYDQSGFTPDKHQILAYKMCLLYYNWTGTVRVPAPCQYAHKLALLCGEHLHSAPNSTLENRLHYL